MKNYLQVGFSRTMRAGKPHSNLPIQIYLWESFVINFPTPNAPSPDAWLPRHNFSKRKILLISHKLSARNRYHECLMKVSPSSGINLNIQLAISPAFSRFRRRFNEFHYELIDYTLKRLLNLFERQARPPQNARWKMSNTGDVKGRAVTVKSKRDIDARI